ncbi:DNA replication complex GINS protein PSF2 [Backusella circina FSU 941]|nr:DNA replication complex GINS protein PSF2 [Backusella circina FSU 941]
MALPRSHQNSFTPSEVEFIASNEKIKIIPNRRFDRLDLIQMPIDRFQPPLTTEVPVWLAVLMKKNNKCSIQCPDWLTVENLSKKIEEEETEEEFSAVPFHYMELSQMLMNDAREDIPNAEQIQKLLQDLRETRQVKARTGLKYLDDKWLGMNNLSLMEINEIRPFFSRAFDEMRKLNSEGRTNRDN